jgi:RimJ/RimL family protein N-acetyltransferase
MEFNFSKEIVLENDRVILRPVTLTDCKHLERIALADKNLLQYSPKQIYTRELLDAYIQNALAERNDKTRYSFSIYCKEHEAYAGSTTYMNVSAADDRLEIGATWLGREFQGTGLNRQCKYLLLHHAFEIIGAHRVEFRTDERNMQSRTAIEKIGGKFEGCLREHMVLPDGYRRNTYCYSILKAEWDAMKGNFLKQIS